MTLDPWDMALRDALLPSGELVSLEELAERTGLPPTLLEVVVREGFLKPARSEPAPMFDPADVAPIKSGMTLVESGLPLGDLLDLARRMDSAMQPIAEQAIEMFSRFVRDSVEVNSDSDEEAAQQLVKAFSEMLPAASKMVEHHFRALLLEGAKRRLRIDS
jgi:hypothetical protein